MRNVSEGPGWRCGRNMQQRDALTGALAERFGRAV